MIKILEALTALAQMAVAVSVLFCVVAFLKAWLWDGLPIMYVITGDTSYLGF